MGVEAGSAAGDPAAGAVDGGAAPVEGGGELPRDERAPVLEGEGPRAVDGLCVLGEEPGLHLDAGLAQAGGTAHGHRVGVGLGEHHAAYARGDQRLRAGTGAAGVVARLEGDDGGRAPSGVTGLAQGLDLGVRPARATVEALGDRRAVRCEEHAPDAGVGTQRHARRDGERQRAPHRGALCLAGRHLRLRSGWDSGGRATGHSPAEREGWRASRQRALLIRTMTVGPGFPPGQPATGCGRVADCDRRCGVPPPPEHASSSWSQPCHNAHHSLTGARR